MVRRRGNQRDARDGVPGLCDDGVDLEPWKLASLTGFRALGDLDLDLLRVDQVFRRDAEASGSDLLGLAGQRNALDIRVIAFVVLTALARIGTRAQPVHRQGNRLVGLDGRSISTIFRLICPVVNGA